MAQKKLYTSKAVAVWLDLSERRVRQLRDEGVLKEERPGLYDMKTAVVCYVRYISGKDGSGAALNKERAELTRAKKEMAQLALEEVRGTLHKTEEIENALGVMLMNFRTRIMAIPAKLAPELAGMNDRAEIFDRLSRETNEALEELSDFDNAFAVRDEEGGKDENRDGSPAHCRAAETGGGGDKAAAQPEFEPMGG